MNPLMPLAGNLPHPTDLLKTAGVAVLYALLAKAVLAFFSANGVVSIVWPPSGLALAVLLIGGKRYAVGVFFGALLANAMTGLPMGTAAIIAVGNTLEAILGAWLLTRDGKFDSRFQSLRDYLRLIVLAGFFGAGVSAINGSTTLLVSGFLGADAYFRNLIHWWMGDAIGILLISKYPNWVATALYKDGHAHYFDGAKDLFKYLHEYPKYAPGHRKEYLAALYVTEFYGLSRVDARQAFFVIGSDVLGPMGHELVALETRADAEEFLKDHKGRRIFTFEQVTAEIVAKVDNGKF